MKLDTLAIHAGYESDPTTKSVAVPIYQTVAYEFDNAQHGADLFNLAVPGNIYTRIMNPTQDALEKRIAALDGGVAAGAARRSAHSNAFATWPLMLSPMNKSLRPRKSCKSARMPRGAVPDLARQCGSGGTLTVGLQIRCGSRKTPVAGPVTPPESWRQRAGVRRSRGSIGLRAKRVSELASPPTATRAVSAHNSVRRRCSRRRQ